MHLQIVLFDINADMIAAWNKEFARYKDHVQYPAVVVHLGVDKLLEQFEVDSLVSPANSFGFMDGGIDGVYSQHIPGIQAKVQKMIRACFSGEIPVGIAEGVETGQINPFEVICAPTMRTPADLRNELAINCYLATRAAFVSCYDMYGVNRIVAIPGMGTGVGGLPKDFVAASMRQAYEDVFINQVHFPKTLTEASIRHREIMDQFYQM